MNKKNILVTGASQGIGLAIAKYFAKTHNVYILSRNEDKLKKLCKEYSFAGYVVADLSTEIPELAFNIDILINNAGVYHYSPIEKMSEEEELREIRRMHEKWDFERKLENDYEFKKGLDKGMEKGVKKGVKKGLKQGIEQGMEKGIEKGVKQGTRNAQVQMVKKMYNLKSNIEFIKQVTGLSQKEIEEIIYSSNIGA